MTSFVNYTVSEIADKLFMLCRYETSDDYPDVLPATRSQCIMFGDNEIDKIITTLKEYNGNNNQSN